MVGKYLINQIPVPQETIIENKNNDKTKKHKKHKKLSKNKMTEENPKN